MPRRHWIALALTVWLIPGITHAADKAAESQWNNLQNLKAGQKIRVTQKDSTSWSGRFIGASDDGLQLQARGADKNIARADVLRVSRHGGKRGRNALIGAAILGGTGLVGGVATGGTNCHGFSDACIGKGTLGGILGVAGAIVGGAIGVAVPGSTVVYRAPSQ